MDTAVAPFLSLEVPAAHLIQVDDPLGENVPVKHVLHVVTEAAISLEYVPAVQFEHDEDPVSELCVPATHGSQVDAVVAPISWL